MRLISSPAPRPLAGTVRVPGDKSIGHRALLFSLLSETPVRVRGMGDGADNGRSAKAIAQLGALIAKAPAESGSIVIRGVGLTGMTAPSAPIDCGNSGTTIRLLCGMLAGQRFATTLVGDASLSSRPMMRVIEPLRAVGAAIEGTPKGSDITPPLTISGASGLHAIDRTLEMASAQVKTALVLAGLYADGETRITEPGPSRDHSERMLSYLGAPIRAHGRTVSVDTRGWNRKLAGAAFTVPGDPSSSAFLVAAAVIAGAQAEGVRLPNVCVNPTRTGFLDAIAAMGGVIELEDRDDSGPEPLATLVIRGAARELRAIEISGDLAVRSIDELPVLAVIAARAKGTTVVRDASELRVKESDRIATTCAMLRAFGVACEARSDGFAVEGTDRPFKAAHVHADADHRIAMAAAVAALVAEGPADIDDADNVATSYPGFAAALTALGGNVVST